MNSIDESCDEIRLTSFILDRLRGHFHFAGTPGLEVSMLLPVDVPATNQELVMNGKGLAEFVQVVPGDPGVVPGEAVVESSGELCPSAVAFLLLCGGLSFRSEGEIHPLKTLAYPNGGQTTLLDLQMDRMAKSPFKKSVCFVVATPLNEAALSSHLAGQRSETGPRLYTGGLAPRLSPNQCNSGPPSVVRDSFGRISYNPVGHLEALRWFVLSGALAQVADCDVAILISYSNWGKVFTNKTLDFSNLLKKSAECDPNLLFLVEVVPRSHEKRTGSMLVAPRDNRTDFKLVKYGYAQGRPASPAIGDILMSTNTWHVSVPNLLRRLQGFSHLIGLAGERAALVDLLNDAARGRQRSKLSDLFEYSFPAGPQLIPTLVNGNLSFLRAERDLDQLSLISGPPLIRVVQVKPDRAISLKVPADFENPANRKLLFES